MDVDLAPWYARIVTTLDGINLHELIRGYGTEADIARGAATTALMARYGIPDTWVGHPDQLEMGWDVSVLEGPLVQARFDESTLHPLEPLPGGPGGIDGSLD